VTVGTAASAVGVRKNPEFARSDEIEAVSSFDDVSLDRHEPHLRVCLHGRLVVVADEFNPDASQSVLAVDRAGDAYLAGAGAFPIKADDVAHDDGVLLGGPGAQFRGGRREHREVVSSKPDRRAMTSCRPRRREQQTQFDRVGGGSGESDESFTEVRADAGRHSFGEGGKAVGVDEGGVGRLMRHADGVVNAQRDLPFERLVQRLIGVAVAG
jgi:hypothetical protein